MDIMTVESSYRVTREKCSQLALPELTETWNNACGPFLAESMTDGKHTSKADRCRPTAEQTWLDTFVRVPKPTGKTESSGSLF